MGGTGKTLEGGRDPRGEERRIPSGTDSGTDAGTNAACTEVRLDLEKWVTAPSRGSPPLFKETGANQEFQHQ